MGSGIALLFYRSYTVRCNKEIATDTMQPGATESVAELNTPSNTWGDVVFIYQSCTVRRVNSVMCGTQSLCLGLRIHSSLISLFFSRCILLCHYCYIGKSDYSMCKLSLGIICVLRGRFMDSQCCLDNSRCVCWISSLNTSTEIWLTGGLSVLSYGVPNQKFPFSKGPATQNIQARLKSLILE